MLTWLLVVIATLYFNRSVNDLSMKTKQQMLASELTRKLQDRD